MSVLRAVRIEVSRRGLARSVPAGSVPPASSRKNRLLLRGQRVLSARCRPHLHAAACAAGQSRAPVGDRRPARPPRQADRMSALRAAGI